MSWLNGQSSKPICLEPTQWPTHMWLRSQHQESKSLVPLSMYRRWLEWKNILELHHIVFRSLELRKSHNLSMQVCGKESKIIGPCSQMAESPKIRAFSVHPGIVLTEMSAGSGFPTLDTGKSNLHWASTCEWKAYCSCSGARRGFQSLSCFTKGRLLAWSLCHGQLGCPWAWVSQRADWEWKVTTRWYPCRTWTWRTVLVKEASEDSWQKVCM